MTTPFGKGRQGAVTKRSFKPGHRWPGLSLSLTFGAWGGIYCQRIFTGWSLCLGWMKITLHPYDLDAASFEGWRALHAIGQEGDSRDKRVAFLRGLYEMQAHCLHALQCIDEPGKKEAYKAIAALDPKEIVERQGRCR